jgi:site-specific recombinase XerD
LSAANLLRLMARLSDWLEDRYLEPGDLTEERVDAFLADRRSDGYVHFLSRRGLAPLLEHLRGLGVMPAPVETVVSGPAEELLERYRAFLVDERGLVASTVRYYLAEARLLMSTRVGPDGLDLVGLSAAEVTRFVVDECAQRSTGSAKILVTAVRSVLRFLLLDGVVERDLTPAVPAVAGWRGSQLPKGLPAGQAIALLRSCDRRRRVGRRDFAILTVMARLGLRASEITALEFGDIDWRRGEVVIRGKGRRDERLPLPVDVGEAIVGYLRGGRPDSKLTRVFLQARAPYGPVSSVILNQVVRQAAVRAGMDPAGVSPHRLRHTLAVDLVRAGAPLTEVGQVLRHRHPATTAIYAKVDRAALRDLAQQWPKAGGAA